MVRRWPAQDRYCINANANADANADTRIPEANLRRLSGQAIRQVVADTGGNMSEAARRLGISRNTLYRRLKDMGSGAEP